MRIVNYVPYQQQKKRLSPFKILEGSIMWAHSDLFKDEQLTSSSSKKKSKVKARIFNVVTGIPEEEVKVRPLTYSEEDIKEIRAVSEDQ